MSGTNALATGARRGTRCQHYRKLIGEPASFVPEKGFIPAAARFKRGLTGSQLIQGCAHKVNAELRA